MSSVVCRAERSGGGEDPPGTATAHYYIDQTATAFSLDQTATAQASITPSPTPAKLHDSVFFITDPQGNTYICGSTESAVMLGADILSLQVLEPAAVGSDHHGWLLRVELGAPADETMANFFSFGVKGEFQVGEESEHPYLLNEGHANNHKKGVCSDSTCQNMVPGTEDLTWIDDPGRINFLIPFDTRQFILYSFGLPTEGGQVACDNLPWVTFNPSPP